MTICCAKDVNGSATLMNTAFVHRRRKRFPSRLSFRLFRFQRLPRRSSLTPRHLSVETYDLGMTSIVIDCAGNSVLSVLVVLLAAGGVTVTFGCDTMDARLAEL